MKEETYLDIERREKNEIIKKYQEENKRLAFELFTLKFDLRKLSESIT